MADHQGVSGDRPPSGSGSAKRRGSRTPKSTVQAPAEAVGKTRDLSAADEAPSEVPAPTPPSEGLPPPPEGSGGRPQRLVIELVRGNITHEQAPFAVVGHYKG